jgi:hypothetical protein
VRGGERARVREHGVCCCCVQCAAWLSRVCWVAGDSDVEVEGPAIKDQREANVTLALTGL